MTAILSAILCVSLSAAPAKPNFVIIFADDLGYGDLGCYGHPTIRTPALDRMAAEGLRFTQFYTAEPVCTPSRAGLLTGRLPIRSGMYGDNPRVLTPNSKKGLPDSEITFPQLLQKNGYATCCIGKWHLGHLPQYLPNRRGFDAYFGIPYSNDMVGGKRTLIPIPLMRGDQVIERGVDQTTLTRRYTEEAVRFLRENKDRPFLLYLPQTFPHVPLYASEQFRGKSARGLYGDVVEELDDGVGKIRAALKELGLSDKTLVVFTSDNGPWLGRKLEGGSAGLLREGKGSTWEGGMRVPALACWPGVIPPGRTTTQLGCTMDLFSTCLELAAVEPPKDRAIDGVSLAGVLTSDSASPRKTVFYYRGSRLMAVRKGPWKAHLSTMPGYGLPSDWKDHERPLLFQLDQDPSERFDVSDTNPAVVSDLMAEAALHRKSVQAVPSQIDDPPTAKP